MDLIEEKELIIKAKNKDLAAYEALYRFYYERIYKYIAFKIGSRELAEDLCQEVFLGAYRNLRSYKFTGAKFSSWLYRIAHNKCMSYFREYLSHEKDLPLSELQADGLNIEEGMVKGEELMILKQAISNLSKPQIEVIELRFFGDASLEETAKAIGKSVGAVKLLQFRAVQKLKDLLSG